MLSGIVDRSSLDGQKTLYVALDASIRKYISAHKSEFYAGGEEEHDEAQHSASGTLHSRDPSTSTLGGGGGETSNPTTPRTKEPLSFIADTVPFSKPFCDFMTTLWDTLADVVGQMSPSTLICSFIIFALFLSNIFTLSSLRKSSSRYIPQRRPLPDYTPSAAARGDGHSTEGMEGQDLVAAAVRGVLHEYFQQSGNVLPVKKAGEVSSERRDVPDSEEAREIWSLIDSLEKRVEALKSSLQEVD